MGGSRTRFGVKHHLSQVMPPIVEVGGLHVTGLARVALDLGREHGFNAGVVACDGVLRRGVTRTDLETELEGMWCWPNITRSREAVVYADPGAESVGESLSRILLDELGLGPVETQFAVRLPTGTVWCDMRIGCHVFEFDGRVKYRRPEQGGLADRPADEVVWDEKKRERLICAEGLGLSRIIWEDLWGAARERTKARLLATPPQRHPLRHCAPGAPGGVLAPDAGRPPRLSARGQVSCNALFLSLSAAPGRH